MQFSLYSGDWKSVQKNRALLEDDDALRMNAPERLRANIDANWETGHDSVFGEYLEFVLGEYGDTMRSRMKDYVALEVNMAASPGATWKRLGFKTKGDFYGSPKARQWLDMYVQYAAPCNWIEPFTAAPKEELTDDSSIEKGKSRVFYIAGVLNDYYGKICCRHFNYAYKQTDMTYIGEPFMYGGSRRFYEDVAGSLEPDMLMFEGDCTKFDLSQSLRFFRLCYVLRRHFAEPQHIPMLKHLYRCAVRKYLLWFDGSIIVTTRCNPSGWVNTSIDNNISSHFLQWDLCCNEFEYDEDLFLSWFKGIVSDDTLCVYPKAMNDEQRWSLAFARWGRIFKGFTREPTDQLEGALFCGMRVVRLGNSWSVVIAPDKSFASANYLSGLSLEQRRNKMMSLATNVAGDPELLREFQRYIAPTGISIDVQAAKDVLLGFDLTKDALGAGF